jgi:transposase
MMNLDSVIAEHDSRWQEVMELAKKHGFIIQAFGGTATLMTNAEQLAVSGADGYVSQHRHDTAKELWATHSAEINDRMNNEVKES